MDEHGEGEPPTSGYRASLFSHKDGVVSCRCDRRWTDNVVERAGEPMPEADAALLEFIDAVADETRQDFPFIRVIFSSATITRSFTVAPGGRGDPDLGRAFAGHCQPLAFRIDFGQRTGHENDHNPSPRLQGSNV